VLPLLQVDAFTTEPFGGNPAAVCFLDTEREASWMQAVAEEMHLSETAFLLPLGTSWSLRWFTPTVEVDLCGHATLAAAHALWETGRAPEARLRFATRSGPLYAARAAGLIELDFPAKVAEPAAAPDGLLDALGATSVVGVLRNEFDYLVELTDDDAVVALAVDHGALRGVPARGVIVTARASADRDADFVSRFFAPGSGVDEDPVTGSAHCALGPFWGARLGRTELTGYQASKRGGTVGVRLEGDRVVLGGRAVTVLRGELDA
jgi:predicted PhzF superfamily epimerase YddE/YHI9